MIDHIGLAVADLSRQGLLLAALAPLGIGS